LLQKSTGFHDEKHQIHKKTLDYKYVTYLPDYEKIGVGNWPENAF